MTIFENFVATYIVANFAYIVFRVFIDLKHLDIKHVLDSHLQARHNSERRRKDIEILLRIGGEFEVDGVRYRVVEVKR